VHECDRGVRQALNIKITDVEIGAQDRRAQSADARACDPHLQDLIKYHGQGRKSHAGRPHRAVVVLVKVARRIRDAEEEMTGEEKDELCKGELAHLSKTDPMMMAQIDAILGATPGQYVLNFFCHGRRYRTHWLDGRPRMRPPERLVLRLGCLERPSPGYQHSEIIRNQRMMAMLTQNGK
jgi:hypothetical protein